MKTFIEFTPTGNPVINDPYDSTRLNLPTTIGKFNSPVPNFGPMPTNRVSFVDVAFAQSFPCVIPISTGLDWIFCVETTTASATRRVGLTEYNKLTSAYTYRGFVTLNFPFAGTQGTYTPRGFETFRYLHTTGTVNVTGVNVGGVGTQFSADRIAVGARIGFGSTKPNNISVWYPIASIASDTALTLATTGIFAASGTSYVIEELRCALALTNGTTATNGGLFVVKGLNYNDFTVGGTTIPTGNATDNLKAVYKFSDAATTTMTTAAGFNTQSPTSPTGHNLYFLNGGGTSNARIFVFNLREALTLSLGQATNPFRFQTGTQVITGTISQNNNSLIATCKHNEGSGVESLYFASTTRINRAPITGIVNGSTSFVTDAMIEVVPVGLNLTTVSSMTYIEYEDVLDRFIISCTSIAPNTRMYATRYKTDATPFDHIFLSDDRYSYPSSIISDCPIYYQFTNSPIHTFWTQDGIMHGASLGTTNSTNFLMSLPLGCDSQYQPGVGHMAILPKFSIPDSVKLYRAYVARDKLLGGDNFGLSTESFDLYYRTSGIDNNTGSWTKLGTANDLSGVTGVTEIQFAVAFRIISPKAALGSIYSLCLIYENNLTDSKYIPSVSRSNINSRIFAWRQNELWNSNIPNLRITIYNVATGLVVLNDTVTSSTSGTWQYSTDGGNTWLAWSNSADAVGNFIRYTATSLPDGIQVRVVISQA